MIEDGETDGARRSDAMNENPHTIAHVFSTTALISRRGREKRRGSVDFFQAADLAGELQRFILDAAPASRASCLRAHVYVAILTYVYITSPTTAFTHAITAT